MSVSPRCCRMRRPRSFSRRPPSSRASSPTRCRPRTLPAPSVVEIDSLDLDYAQRIRGTTTWRDRTLRICSTPPGRPARRPGSWSPTQPVDQLGADGRDLHSRLPDAPDHGVVAAVLPRHGVDVRCVHRNPGWMVIGDHESDSLPSATCPMDAAAGTQPAGIVGSAELRFHARRRTNVGRGHGRARPRGRVVHQLRCRAGQSGHHHAFQPSGSLPTIFPSSAIRPSYGLAEATVFVAADGPGDRRFRPFRAREVVGGPREAMHYRHAVGELRQAAVASIVRIVDPETATENPAEIIGEIWVHGDNVSSGYWQQTCRDGSRRSGRRSPPRRPAHPKIVG